MTRGTVPTLHCDDESGCTEWCVDYYTLTADNWKSLLGGWTHDPYDRMDKAFCPEHKPDGAA